MAERLPLRALSLWQPWAWCIAPGPRVAPKRVENRSWTPRLEPGDLLAIHAAARTDPSEEARVALRLRRELGVIVPEGLPRGAIVAVAVFDGCEFAPRWLEGPGGSTRRDPWWAGPVGWYLRDVVALPEPVPCRGAQGLWVVEGEALERVRAGYLAALPRSVAVLLPRGDRWAAIRSAKHSGAFEVPGGKVEPGESLVAAAERECREEAGVTPRGLRPVLTGPCGGHLATVFLAAETTEELVSSSEGEACWATRDEIEGGTYGGFVARAFERLNGGHRP